MYGIAPLHGVTIQYAYLPWDEVVLVKPDHSITIIQVETFNYLYHEIDGHRAALKEDCIQYVIYDTDKLIMEYPVWYMDAIDDGYIYSEEDYDDLIFYCEYGDIVMNSGDVILRNFMGELKYVTRFEFDKYYDIGGSD